MEGQARRQGIETTCRAAGSAYAFKLNGTDRVSVAFFGDGASNNGAFHEGVNMATVWKLPVLFVCENNQYATEIAFRNVARVQDVSARAAGYALPGVTVDGNDVSEVWEAFGRFLAAARTGGGPFLLECLTHRVRGHYEGDPGRYREALAEAEWREKDPILRLERQGRAAGWFDEEGLGGIAAAAADAVERAVRFARESPFPPADLTERMVYADG